MFVQNSKRIAALSGFAGRLIRGPGARGSHARLPSFLRNLEDLAVLAESAGARGGFGNELEGCLGLPQGKEIRAGS